MTKNRMSGTLSTSGNSDKKLEHPKEKDIIGKMKSLLGAQKVLFLPHANKRMGQRNIIYFEVLQALTNGKHDPKRDRFSNEHKSWEYSIEGKTNDTRPLRIGISFAKIEKTGEKLLIITVIDPESKSE